MTQGIQPNIPGHYGDHPLAAWPYRAGGAVIDYGVPLFLWGVARDITIAPLSNLVFLLGLAYLVGNSVIFGGNNGRALGHRVFGLYLARRQGGNPPGPILGAFRLLGHIIDTLACYLGWLWPLWDHRRQTFADKMANTIVVRQTWEGDGPPDRWPIFRGEPGYGAPPTSSGPGW